MADFPPGHKEAIDAAVRDLVTAARKMLAISEEHAGDPSLTIDTPDDIRVVIIRKEKGT